MSIRLPPAVCAALPDYVLCALLGLLRAARLTDDEISGGLLFAASQGVTNVAQIEAATLAWIRYGNAAFAAAGPRGGWITAPGSPADRVVKVTRGLEARAMATRVAGIQWRTVDLRGLVRDLRIAGQSQVSAGRLPYVTLPLTPLGDMELHWAPTAMAVARDVAEDRARGLPGHGWCRQITANEAMNLAASQLDEAR